jgi:serine/threonine protein kinase
MSTSGDDAVLAELPSEYHSICNAFEQAWQQGHCPAIEALVRSAPEPLRPRMTEELLRLELDLRSRAGEQPRVEEYAARFPDLAAALPGWLEEVGAAAKATETPSGSQPQSAPLTRYDPAGAPATGGPPRLLGEYEVGEKLGGGGMGVVYRARHRRLDRPVALKLLPVDALESSKAVTRFLREMRAVGGLKHPNIVEAHDAGERDGIVYLVMELLDGEDLEQQVRRRGLLPVAEACELARQAALGLNYLHQRGLVHRDIKPSNLLRTTEGVVKVLDLGLARWSAEPASDLTGPGACLGTPDFMAPEQGRDAAVADGRVDLYGLGATLFYLLTSEAPFARRKGLHAKLDAHQTEAPPDVRMLRPEVPPALAELVRRLLAKEPGDRPQSAAEVASSLSAFVGLSAPAAPTVSDTGSSQSPKRVRRWLGVAGGVLVVLGLGGLALWAMLHSGGGPPSSSGAVAVATPATTQPTVRPLTIQLHVRRLSADGVNPRPLGEGGETTYRVRFKERVDVEATLSEPSYAYLIAFNPTDQVADQVQLIPPSEATQPPRQSAEVGGQRLLLNDGEGLQAFAVVASRQPLPAFTEWHKQHLLPWHLTGATRGAVWQSSGERVEGFYDDDSVRAQVEGASDKKVIGDLANLLRQISGVEAVSVIGFAVDRVD